MRAAAALAALAALLWAGPARAQQRIVLLPLDGDPRVARKAEGLALEALKRLDRTGQLGSLPLAEGLMAVGCTEPSAQCLTEVGRLIEADLLLHGGLQGGAAETVRLSAFDVPRARAAGSVDVATRGDDLGPFIDGLRVLLGIKAEGALEVRSPVPGVEVLIDGVVRGATPLRVEALAEGRHVVEGRRVGYKPWSGAAHVVAGRTSELEIVLEEEPAAVARPQVGWRARLRLDRFRARTYLTAGAGVGLVGLGLIFGAMAGSAQDHVDRDPIDAYSDVERLHDKADSGKTFATLATIGAVAGGAALAGAGVLGYLDWRAGETATVSLRPDGLALTW